MWWIAGNDSIERLHKIAVKQSVTNISKKPHTIRWHSASIVWLDNCCISPSTKLPRPRERENKYLQFSYEPLDCCEFFVRKKTEANPRHKQAHFDILNCDCKKCVCIETEMNSLKFNSYCYLVCFTLLNAAWLCVCVCAFFSTSISFHFISVCYLSVESMYAQLIVIRIQLVSRCIHLYTFSIVCNFCFQFLFCLFTLQISNHVEKDAAQTDDNLIEIVKHYTVWFNFFFFLNAIDQIGVYSE